MCQILRNTQAVFSDIFIFISHYLTSCYVRQSARGTPATGEQDPQKRAHFCFLYYMPVPHRRHATSRSDTCSSSLKSINASISQLPTPPRPPTERRPPATAVKSAPPALAAPSSVQPSGLSSQRGASIDCPRRLCRARAELASLEVAAGQSEAPLKVVPAPLVMGGGGHGTNSLPTGMP